MSLDYRPELLKKKSLMSLDYRPELIRETLNVSLINSGL